MRRDHRVEPAVRAGACSTSSPTRSWPSCASPTAAATGAPTAASRCPSCARCSCATRTPSGSSSPDHRSTDRPRSPAQLRVDPPSPARSGLHRHRPPARARDTADLHLREGQPRGRLARADPKHDRRCGRSRSSSACRMSASTQSSTPGRGNCSNPSPRWCRSSSNQQLRRPGSRATLPKPCRSRREGRAPRTAPPAAGHRRGDEGQARPCPDRCRTSTWGLTVSPARCSIARVSRSVRRWQPVARGRTAVERSG